jgi:two-component system, OmpR family, sensor histidine kinase KdpD
MVQRFANASAKPVGGRAWLDSPPEDEPTLRRVLRANILPLTISLMAVGIVTAGMLLLERSVAFRLVPIAYLIPVIVAATQWGVWPATLASIAATAASDFFFVLPLYSLRIDDPQDAVDLLLFLIVALVSSNLASRLRRETETLRRRETEIQQLYEFSRLLTACFTVSDLISAIQKHLSRTLGRPAAFFPASTDSHFEPPVSGSVPKVIQETVAAMTAAPGMPSAAIIDEPTQHVWLLEPVCSDAAVHGLVALNIGGGSRQAIETKTRRTKAVLEEVSLMLQRSTSRRRWRTPGCACRRSS